MAQALPKPRNNDTPYNRFVTSLRGDVDDTAHYTAVPGGNFLRPWLRIPNGPAFVWPLGIEGFSLSIDPATSVHKYVGDNAVEVEVTHMGEERFTLSGTFPGVTSSATMRALRDLVYRVTPPGGKLLYVPKLLTYAQRVVIGRTEFSHAEDAIGSEDLSYSIEFIRIGIAGRENSPPITDLVNQPTVKKKAKGKATRTFVSNSKYNTLTKIALKTKVNWRTLYNNNAKFFTSRHLGIEKAHTYPLPNGTKISY